MIYNVGVTEMRIGQLDKALKRFKKSLLLQPHFQTAQDNINDLLDFIENSRYDIKDLLQINVQRHIRKIPKIITLEEFVLFNDFYYESIPLNDSNGLLKEPFIVKDYYKIWNIDNNTLTIDELIKEFGKRKLNCRLISSFYKICLF